MTDPIKLHEMKHIENTDGLVVHVMTGADEGLPLPPDGISVMSLGLEVDERWVLCWARMPTVSYPCEKCDELVPENEHCGNDRPDGSSEYLCPDCYVPEAK